MTILDRYVLGKFLVPFFYCFAGFVGIWFIFDLADNLQDFIYGNARFDQLLYYYSTQVPEIIVIALPLATLLALLYSLAAMSRSNEIISMLGAGRSITRILVPLIAAGVVLTVLTAFFNYEGAPKATGMKKEIVGNIKHGRTGGKPVKGHLFVNREDRRVWFVSRMPLGHDGTLGDLQVVQLDGAGNISQQWYAQSASYRPETGEWVFQGARHIVLAPDGDILESRSGHEITQPGWRETPWRVGSSKMKADFLSVPELRDYLKYNADFPARRLAGYWTHLHYRWALPTVCLLVVFVAAPCAIVYSRRGVLGGVAMAITLFFLLVFFSSLFVALGKGARVPPAVAAWGPLAVFFLIGLILLWLRTTNRELPKFRLPGL
jgi:lipopolysaccharide export system permease protein